MDRAASRLGCVCPIIPRVPNPLCRQIFGSWVVLPDPVGPHTAIIPFGIVGALYGHFLMGITPTILSMFGLFALSGIVVNDSIILVVFYKQLRERGMAVKDAIVEAACQRLRAVLLTSLTTIAGLLPLLFETSLQAQFLIPMAVSISFGLAFATFLVLLLVPSLLSALEGARLRLFGLRLAGEPALPGPPDGDQAAASSGVNSAK